MWTTQNIQASKLGKFNTESNLIPTLQIPYFIILIIILHIVLLHTHTQAIQLIKPQEQLISDFAKFIENKLTFDFRNWLKVEQTSSINPWKQNRDSSSFPKIYPVTS